MLYNAVSSDGWQAFKMTYQDALALEACILEAGDGDYLEIGVRMGGSAIFAGLVKQAAGQTGNIYGIDNMGPGMAAKGVTPEGAIWRAKKYGVELNLIVADSNPWPAPDIRPVVALIDGDHRYSVVFADWRNLKERTTRFILFHDANQGDVAKVVEEVKGDPFWRFVGQSGCTAVFECASS